MFVSQDIKDLEFQTKIFTGELVQIKDLNFFIGNNPIQLVKKSIAPVDFQVQPENHYQSIFISGKMSEEEKYKFASVFGYNFPPMQPKDQLIIEWQEWVSSGEHSYARVTAVIQREANLEVQLAEKRKANQDYLDGFKTAQIIDEKLRLGLLVSGNEKEQVRMSLPVNFG